MIQQVATTDIAELICIKIFRQDFMHIVIFVSKRLQIIGLECLRKYLSLLERQESLKGKITCCVE